MPEKPYVLHTLTLSGFRAFLEPKTFDLSAKRSIAVFAPNGHGKSSIIDAIEFMFSEDATLERLGVRAIHNQAGPAALSHNLAADRRIPSFVGMTFKRGAEQHEGQRYAAGPARHRPPVATAVRACFAASPLIRGHALRRFVEEQPAEERYEDVARWLQLGSFVEVQRNLRTLRQQVKAAAEDRAALSHVGNQLARKTGDRIKNWDDAAVLAHANAVLATMDERLILETLDRSDAALLLVQQRAKAELQQLGFDGLRQIRQTAAVLYDEQKTPEDGITVTGLLPKLEQDLAREALAAATEQSERSVAANAVFADIWKAAEPLFAEGRPPLDACPVCDTPLNASKAGSVEGVRSHIAIHRTALVEYAMAKEALDDAKSAVRTTRGQLITALKALPPLLSEEHKLLKEALVTHSMTLGAWTSGSAPDATALVAKVHDLTVATDDRIAQIEAETGETTYTGILAAIHDLLGLKEEYDLALRTRGELEALNNSLNAQAAFIATEIRAKVQSLLDTLQKPINDIYREIQGSGSPLIRLELPPAEDVNQQRLNLLIDFADNRQRVQPGGYLSDSQIHTLALALRLAAIKQFNAAAPIIALDDVVTSYDADHRRAITALVAKEFTDCQIIVVTHDERFFTYLKDQLGDASWQYLRITSLEPETGPRFAGDRITDEMIEARWRDGESASNEMRKAEEEWLLGLCRGFGVNLRIRPIEKPYTYDRAELAVALASFLRDQRLSPPTVPGVNNRFLMSLQQGVVENFGSHFQDGPYGDGSKGDEKARWTEFRYFREHFSCPSCGGGRFKRPSGLNKGVCAKEGCEAQFAFGDKSSSLPNVA